MLVTASLLILVGICIYSMISHLLVAFSRPIDRVHLLFAGMCLFAIGLGITNALLYRTQDLAGYLSILRWNLASILCFFMLFIWFFPAFCRRRASPWVMLSSLAFAMLFIVNLMEPGTLQYRELIRLESLRLPWGETVTHPVGQPGFAFRIGVLLVLASIGHAFHLLLISRHAGARRTFISMAVALLVLLGLAIEGILVRSGSIDFVHLGPFGFLLMVIIMSVSLNEETRYRLLSSERRFRSLVEQSPFSIQVLSPDGHTRQVNGAWEKLWGLSGEMIAPYNILEDRQLVAKGVMGHIREGFSGVARDLPPIVYNPAENPVIRGPVRDRWVKSYIYPIKDRTGVISDVILMHQDVTEKKRIEDAIRRLAEGGAPTSGPVFYQNVVLSLATIFDVAYAYIAVLDESEAERMLLLAFCAHGDIRNEHGFPLAGSPAARVLGQVTRVYPAELRNLFPGDAFLKNLNADSFLGTPLFDTEHKPIGLIAVMDERPLLAIEQGQEILEIFAVRVASEIQRQQAETNIRRMAYQDYLTGLPNRARLHEWIGSYMQHGASGRHAGALLLIDLDHFKTINDALGHDVGDGILCAVARALADIASDWGIVARLGGDEFVVFLDIEARDDNDIDEYMRETAKVILDRLSRPIHLGERVFRIGASVGVALVPREGCTVHDLLRHADMALHQAKRMGRGNIQVYERSLHAAAETRLRLEEGLRRAEVNGELELYYQGQVRNDGRVIGAEVLLRWHHPEMGDISPATFIPVAEETGLIHGIGGWVFNQACERLAAWRRDGVCLPDHLSINVCSWQFARPDFVDEIRHGLAEHGIDPRLLMLEVTESALMYDLDDAVLKLGVLRDMGIGIALDDFGTGYSSLAYLRDLPLDQLKIDKSFISELTGEVKHPLAETIISIGRHMKLSILAEGVETKEQHARLSALGCHLFQGFLFCKPMPESDYLAWLGDHQPDHDGGR